MKKVFLGGTCNGSLWRQDVIDKLKIDYFNPVGETWTREMMQEEIRQREICDYCLYVLTPKMEGFYSIAEVVDDSNKRPDKTIFCFVKEDDGNVFNDFQLKSLKQIGEMIEKNGARSFTTVHQVVDYLNHQ